MPNHITRPICTSGLGSFAENRLAAGRCPSCEILVINGVRCHETGCPEAWRDELRECAWCGTEFVPTERRQQFCEESCAEEYTS